MTSLSSEKSWAGRGQILLISFFQTLCEYLPCSKYHAQYDSVVKKTKALLPASFSLVKAQVCNPAFKIQYYGREIGVTVWEHEKGTSPNMESGGGGGGSGKWLDSLPGKN